MSVFCEVESEVRYYCRRWPAVFATASGATLTDEAGVSYLDFFSGAGALSYGHNNPVLQAVAIEHLRAGRLTHSLDTWTPEKRTFLAAIRERILVPRGLDMVVQCVGPTGATAVEAALRLAGRVTGRRGVVAYAGGFHGMTDRAAAVSGSLRPRPEAPEAGCVFLPYVGRATPAELDRLAGALAAALGTPVAGQRPGALIIEAVQAEGGARPFDPGYLAAVRRLCTEHGVVVIADEIQAGVGRTGPFFSFEGSELAPDIICLSKSLSGLGLPLAVNLLRRGLDVWAPGEFSGTFRGNNLAFATAAAMIQRYWSGAALAEATERRGKLLRDGLVALARELGRPDDAVSGRGLIWGLSTGDGGLAGAIADAAFERRLLVETCGAGGGTVKLLPPLTVGGELGDELGEGLDDVLLDGLDRLAGAVRAVRRPVPPPS
jgi:diaminobutyrate-2-oxoglutarate transaminase